jgi:hypothetical protein
MWRDLNLLISFPAAIILCLSPKALPAADEVAQPRGLVNPFFALCVSTHDPAYATPDRQAKLLKELGYAGMAHVWLDGLPAAIKAVDENGLTLSQVYIRASLVPGKPEYDPRLKDAIRSLKGRDTILWLNVTGNAPDGDDQGAKVVGQKEHTIFNGEQTVRDRLWLFSFATNSDYYHIGRRSVMSAAEGNFYLDIPNIMMVQSAKKEAPWGRFDPPFEQYTMALRPLKEWCGR